MLLCWSDRCRGLPKGDVSCNAKSQGRRSPGHGGSSTQKQKARGGSSSSSNGSSPASSAAVSRTTAAAKAAAKRASMFSQQRYERAAAAATLQLPSSLRDQLADTAEHAAHNSDDDSNADDDGDAYGSSSSSSSQRGSPLLQPYAKTVVEHLQRTGALSSANSSSSSSSDSSSGSSSRGRGAKRGAARSLLESHSAVFQAALDLELAEEWREAEARLQSWPLSRLSSEGVALFGLSAAPAGGLFRDVLLRFFLPNRQLPFHSFSQGDIVLVSRGDPLEDSHEAVVVDFSSRWIRLALNPTAAAAVAAAAGRNAAWRLDLFANTVSHERCSEALKRFAAVAAGQQQLQQQQQSLGFSGQQQQQQEALWRVLAGVIPQGQSVQSAAALVPPWLRSQSGRERLAAARAGLKRLLSSGTLNASQAKAVEAALARTCTLWQGPPGTGKTTTLLRFCEAAVQLLSPVGGQILAVAASNVAVDNLVAGLLALGVKVVRLGQPVKVAPAHRSVSLEVLAAATPAGQAAAQLRQQLVAAAAAAAGSRGGGSSKRGSSSKRGGSSSSSSSGQGQWEQMLALEAAAAAEVLGSVQVVTATCVGAGDPVIAGRCFEVVVVDEATQATEPAALVATAARAQTLVMVGDPQQLPPTVKCRDAERLGLGLSMFDRLQSMGLHPVLLDVQYRMHPGICAFPAAQFYGGLLKSWPKPQDRPLPGGIAWPNPQVPVLFIQCNGPDSRTAASISISRTRETGAATDSKNEDAVSSSNSSGDGGSNNGGYSFFNASEAAAVVGCLEQLLLGGGLAAADVGVITPYSGQVRMIQQLLPGCAGTIVNGSNGGSGGRDWPSGSNSRTGSQKGDSVAKDNRSDIGHGSSSNSRSNDGNATKAGKLTGSVLVDLEVKSVDGFQGREKEVIIFSAVRSNRFGRVGFLSDFRRLNVALTRAKRGLIVVGDARTLRSDKVWAAWLQWAERQGVVVGSVS